ncbi:MAG: periplasmic heavy metal sensor [Pseudomonadota bacterium]
MVDTGNLPPRRRWRRVLLAGSLALNLFLIGGVAGVALIAGKSERGAPPVADLELFRMVALLPQEDRRELRDRLRETRDPVLGIDWRRGFRDRLVAELTAETPSADAIAALLAEQRETSDRIAARVERAYADFIVTLPQADRAAYAERLERLRDRKRHGGHRDKSHRD